MLRMNQMLLPTLHALAEQITKITKAAIPLSHQLNIPEPPRSEVFKRPWEQNRSWQKPPQQEYALYAQQQQKNLPYEQEQFLSVFRSFLAPALPESSFTASIAQQGTDFVITFSSTDRSDFRQYQISFVNSSTQPLLIQPNFAMLPVSQIEQISISDWVRLTTNVKKHLTTATPTNGPPGVFGIRYK